MIMILYTWLTAILIPSLNLTSKLSKTSGYYSRYIKELENDPQNKSYLKVKTIA